MLFRNLTKLIFLGGFTSLKSEISTRRFMEAGIYCPPEMTVELDHVLGLNSDFVKEVLLNFISDRSLSVPNVNRFFPYFWLKNKKTKQQSLHLQTNKNCL